MRYGLKLRLFYRIERLLKEVQDHHSRSNQSSVGIYVLHYVFDMWMKSYASRAPYERYAGDGVVHCRGEEEIH